MRTPRGRLSASRGQSSGDGGGAGQPQVRLTCLDFVESHRQTQQERPPCSDTPVRAGRPEGGRGTTAARREGGVERGREGGIGRRGYRPELCVCRDDERRARRAPSRGSCCPRLEHVEDEHAPELGDEDVGILRRRRGRRVSADARGTGRESRAREKRESAESAARARASSSTSLSSSRSFAGDMCCSSFETMKSMSVFSSSPRYCGGGAGKKERARPRRRRARQTRAARARDAPCAPR